MKPTRGFSVLEILIAMALLLVAIGSATLMSPGVQSTSVDTQLDAEALTKVQRILENQQLLARKDFKLVNPDSATSTDGSFQTRVYATPVDFFTKKVTALVSWTPQYGRHQEISLSTLVGNFQNAIGGDTCSSILSGNWASPQTVSTNLIGTLLADAGGTYPITDVEAYQKRVYVTVGGSSQNTGIKSPTTASNKTGTGTVAWTPSPSNAANTNDGTNVSAVLSGGKSSNYLWVTGFGPSLAIPKGATILGITVDIWRSASNSSAITDSQIRLIKPDGVSMTASLVPSNSTWSTSKVDVTYGSASSLWGDQWTASDIDNPNFGVAFSVNNTSGSTRTANVDYVSVTVTYVKQFYAFNVSNPASPTYLGDLSATSTAPVATGYKAVAVATSTATGAYAFALTSGTSNQLQVLDINGSAPILVNSYTLPNATGVAANTIFYKDGYVYIGTASNGNSPGPELYVIDVHNPLTIPTLLTGEFVYDVGAGVNDIYVKNNKVYLATDDTARELVVLDVNDLAHPALYGVYDAPGTTGGQGKSLYTVGDTAYFGRYYSLVTNTPEFHILSTAGAAPALLGVQDIGTSANTFGVYDVIVRDYLSFFLTGNTTAGNGKLQIFNTKNPASITQLSSLDLPNAGAPVSLDCEGNYIYAASVPVSGANLNKGSLTIITAP